MIQPRVRPVVLGLGLGIVLGVGALTFSLFAGCGSDPSNAPHAASGDGSATADGPPLRAAFGLDVRPSNTTCLAPARPPSGIKLTPAFPNLTFESPVLVLQAPGAASKWYVVEQGGDTGASIQVFDNNPNVATKSDFLRFNVNDIVLGATQEGGLLGFAFHPDYASNGAAFLSYTAPSPTSPVNMKSLVTRIKKKSGTNELDRSTEETLISSDGRRLAFDQPATEHKNCTLAFGKDGDLYIGFGDGGEKDGINAQDKTGYLAKILRINVGATGPYTIPSDNPWVANPLGIGELKETWANGLRNPWRWSFDRQSGDLWAGDVGNDLYEEVDRVVKGGNYGWPLLEGFHCEGGGTCDKTGLMDPVIEYPHANADRAIVGGYVYRGTKIPFLVGSYVFGDVTSGRISRIVYDPVTKAAAIEDLAMTNFSVTSFGESADGELYVIDYLGGKLYRIDPALSGPNPVSHTLSATGCVNPTNAKEPAAGLIPYGVNMPLWSDGAEKRRWLAIPDGTTIQVMPDGDWNLPIGSVLMKEFSLGGKAVETRLLVRHDDGEWGGYSYEWNDAQTDATLLPLLKTKRIGNQDWTFPGRTHCLQCHTGAAGRTLGLESGQLNGDVAYPSTNRLSNQLATLDHIGLFAAPLGDVAALARFPTIDGPEPIDVRARAYLHANCSGCHRPQGGGGGPMDLRMSTPFAGVNACNAAPWIGDLGVKDSKLLAPGDPSKSVLSLRMHATDASRMPPVASRVVHTQGTSLIDSWIQSLKTCP